MSRECLGAGALGNKDTNGSVCVRKLLGSLDPAHRPLFMLCPLPRALFCLLRFSKSPPKSPRRLSDPHSMEFQRLAPTP